MHALGLSMECSWYAFQVTGVREGALQASGRGAVPRPSPPSTHFLGTHPAVAKMHWCVSCEKRLADYAIDSNGICVVHNKLLLSMIS